MTPLGRTAVHTVRSDSTVETRYLHQDALGSIDAVTNEYGQVEKRFTYDAWGKRATPVDNHTGSGGKMTRGFTDHEMLDDFGLIHMNGRVYDPVLGRFLSADPYVQAPGNSQSYNRYSYCANNPLNATDPTGYSSLGEILPSIIGIAVAAVIIIWPPELLPSLKGLWLAMAAGASGGFASGFSGSLLNGGSLGDAFKAGAIGGFEGGISAGLFSQAGTLVNGIKDQFEREFLRTIVEGGIGGSVSEAQGGKFCHGFYPAALCAAVGDNPAGINGKGGWAIAGRTAVASVIGGTASALGGGKFGNGAMTGAFQHLFNDEFHRKKAPNSSLAAQMVRSDGVYVPIGGYRALSADERRALDSTLAGLSTLTSNPMLQRLYNSLAGRNYLVMNNWQDMNADWGMTFPTIAGEENNIYLNPDLFTKLNVMLRDANGNYSINWSLLEIMTHEDTHLRLGPFSPSGNSDLAAFVAWQHTWIPSYTDRVFHTILNYQAPASTNGGSGK